MIEFVLNGKKVSVTSDADTPLLWVIREELQLTGTKFGCGIAQCGACTVLMNGSPIRSCVMPVSAIAGSEITSIEGLEEKHPLQQAWVELDVPQCGYCQSGQIMSAVGLLKTNPSPSDQQIKEFMSGNICRCGAYPEIFAAIKKVVNGKVSVASDLKEYSKFETYNSKSKPIPSNIESNNSNIGFWQPEPKGASEVQS